MTASSTAIEAAPLVSADRPIIFSAPMVRAILKGHKTQTRRIVNLDTLRVRLPRAVSSDWPQLMAERRVEARLGVRHAQLHDAGAVSVAAGDGWLGAKPGEFHFVCPYCGGDTHLGQYGDDDKRWTIIPEPGARLWVRETFSTDARSVYPCDPVLYRADVAAYPYSNDDPANAEHVRNCNRNQADCYACLRERSGFKWKPSIFMRRAQARLELDVLGVRVERLQDISEEDVIAEGVDAVPVGDVPRQAAWSRRQDFANLWDIINRKRAPWALNPWVWRIEFKRVRP